MKNKKKIVFLISSLGSGGAERVVSELANNFSNRYHVTIITLSNQDDFYFLENNVTRIRLDLLKNSKSILDGIKNNIVRMRIIRQTLKSLQPDVAISFMDKTNIFLIISSIGLPFKKLVSERNNPNARRYHFIWRLLRLISYYLSDGLIVQTEPIKRWARRFMASSKVHVIHNPLKILDPHEKSENNTKINLIATMGRLVPQKATHIAIDAFARVHKNHPDWKLVVIGDGPLKSELKSLALNLGVSNKVEFAGAQKNPHILLKSASIFVMSSIYEGFPNALIEAMALGIPPISTNCDFGPSDIITDGKNGILVGLNDAQALAEKIDYLITNPKIRSEMGLAAKYVVNAFAIEKIASEWELVINL